MRTSRLSTALVSALAVLALTATGCNKKNSDPPAPSECTLAPLNASCTAGTECCSGNCFKLTGAAQGTCVADANQCGDIGATCGAPGDCCQGACPNGKCADPNSCGAQLGESCQYSTDCCTGSCEGAQNAKVCTKSSGGCLLAGTQCTGATPAEKNASCCTGYCDATSNQCATPPVAGCIQDKQACNISEQCCSKVCGDDGFCKPARDTCVYEGEACESDAECCSRICPNAGTAGATCSSGMCLQLGDACSPTNNTCCSGVCGSTHTCEAPPVSGTKACTTLNEACTYTTDCCSGNCQNVTISGGVPVTGSGTCMPVASCNAFGDVCYRPEDCCSGLCTGSGTTAGRCDMASGSCGQDGYPCTKDEDCCSRGCRDSGTGAKACVPTDGCRINGDYCDVTAACCNINSQLSDTNQWVTCDPVDHTCENGTGCNPPGDVCGYKASQNCCHTGGGSGSQVCKADNNGVMRCFGGWVDPPTCQDTSTSHCCKTGWEGDDPLCCIQPGQICQFADQCCNNSPCTMADDGVLRCAAPACLATGATCSTAGAPPNNYTAVQGDCCAPNQCYYVGIEVGWRCASTQPPQNCIGTGAACTTNGTACCFGATCTNGTCAQPCKALDASCTGSAQCCSGNCEGNVCRPPCVPGGESCNQSSQCCTGLSCIVPDGATQGTCTTTGGGGGDPGCAQTGQSCATLACCNAPPVGTDTCDTTTKLCTAPVKCHETAQSCTVGGGECCSGLQCYMLTGLEERVDCVAGNSCFCDVPACAATSAACSTIVPCCNVPCADNATGGPCTSTDTAACTCDPVG